MRWFARRLAFYVFAIWVALTINFLLPRLMPGSPLGGLLQHLTPSQLSANPGIVQTYEALLGGGHHSIWQDYVTMAHAKGLRDRRVMTRYAGRNAILPPLNGFAALFASAVGGLVFVEYIFSYPGAGYTLQQAVLGNDYALAQAILVVFSVCVIVANLLMDVLNLVLDPRLRTG